MAEPLPKGDAHLLVAVAGVDTKVAPCGAVDVHGGRVFPMLEGRVVRGFEGLDVGDAARVRLLAVDAEKSFIDFERACTPLAVQGAQCNVR